ncbi:DUF3349 domain-containing protein [Micromonospora sp. NPDC093244]|uniref:DUF3349 domain-containing protein n=1 Tax=Micromonospora sp. NPDC093244 TaxID=3155071 RepID=UPI00341EB271
MMEEPLLRVLNTLRTAYPQGVPESDYYPLLVVLSDGMGEENLGKVAGDFLNIDPHIIVHDAVAAVTTRRPSRNDVERVAGLMESAGWDPDNDW